MRMTCMSRMVRAASATRVNCELRGELGGLAPSSVCEREPPDLRGAMASRDEVAGPAEDGPTPSLAAAEALALARGAILSGSSSSSFLFPLSETV